MQAADDLAGVRDPARLAKLPEPERQAWQELWSDLESRVSRSPAVRLQRARAFADRREWKQAAGAYTALLNDAPTRDGEVWFECAAVQLLSGDGPAYRRSCQRMVQEKMRSYLVARAWTLAPNLAAEAQPAADVSSRELLQNSITFWSLTEQGALACRTDAARNGGMEREKKIGVPLFEQSLKADWRPGPAVVNWMWLALAWQKQGDTARAREWLDRGVTWLDGFGDERPNYADERWGWHRHNWLEAHVLRREAESLIRSHLEQ
jgi:hypothetical protein